MNAMVIMVILTLAPGLGSGLTQTASEVSAATCQQAQKSAAKTFEMMPPGYSGQDIVRRIDCIPIIPVR
jgi:hypothetical protein